MKADFLESGELNEDGRHPWLVEPGGDWACVETVPGRWIEAEGPFERVEQPLPDQVAFYVNDFWLSEAKPWRVPRQWRWRTGPRQVGPMREQAVGEVQWKAPDEAAFGAIFLEASGMIARGELQKAVLVATETGLGPPWEGGWLAQRALGHTEHGWAFAFDEAGQGWAGVTPECLFSLRGNKLTTMALAGTARPEGREAFEHDVKEHREHEMVADTLMQKLAPWGEVRRGPREVLSLGGLIHFLTRIEVRLDPDRARVAELIRLLHPTPAMGILPESPAATAQLRSWRERLGTPARFGAPFGVQWPGGFVALVAIRGVFWDQGQLSLPSGCGVVEGSHVASEWRELALKRDWVKKALALAPRPEHARA
jgi:menaquinone-specific isochorismate synthase